MRTAETIINIRTQLSMHAEHLSVTSESPEVQYITFKSRQEGILEKIKQNLIFKRKGSRTREAKIHGMYKT